MAGGPAACLPGELVVGHRLGLGQQGGVGLHGAGLDPLGGLRQPGRIGERHPARLQRLPHAGHVLENPGGAGLALRLAPGHPGCVAQHPGTTVAVSLQPGQRRGGPCLVGGELRLDRLRRLQVAAKLRGTAVADGRQHPGDGRLGHFSLGLGSGNDHAQTLPQGYDKDRKFPRAQPRNPPRAPSPGTQPRNPRGPRAFRGPDTWGTTPAIAYSTG